MRRMILSIGGGGDGGKRKCVDPIMRVHIAKIIKKEDVILNTDTLNVELRSLFYF